MSAAAESTTEASQEERWIFNRHSEILNRLSDEAKWEVTRRHPYYQMFWRSARADGSLDVPDQLRDATRLVLQCIGVRGEYPSPATRFSELVPSTLNRAWLQGAISQVDVRNLSMLLVQILSPAALQELAEVFTMAAARGLDDPSVRSELMNRLHDSNVDGFDRRMPELFLTINPHAPVSAITEAVTSVVQQVQQERNIPGTRNRENCLPDYLAVWDLREGWNGSTYEVDWKQSIASIASEFGISTSTAHNRYRSAFEQIIGHAYNPTRWWRTMGLLTPPDLQSWSEQLRRPINRRSLVPVPESRLGCGLEPLSQCDYLSLCCFGNEQAQLAILTADVQELINRGMSNREIVEQIREDWEIDHALDESLIENLRNSSHGPP